MRALIPGLDELQAGLLRVRLSHLDELTAQRRAIAQRYLTEIRNPRIELPVTAEGCTHVYHLFVVQTEERERFMSYLKENGVGCDVHYPTPPFLAKPYRHLAIPTPIFRRQSGFTAGSCPFPSSTA